MSSARIVFRKIWTRDSSILLGGFLLTIFLIVYIWWPLAEEYLSYVDWHGEWWRYMDWLLLGIFGFMSITIITRANLRTDGLIIFVGIFGGLAIESWGTQTNLWHYYTAERPPLWIIPAWPIAALSIDRIARFLNFLTTKVTKEHKGAALSTPKEHIVLHSLPLSQGQDLVTSLSYGVRPVNAGRITRIKRRHCLRSLRMVWLQL